MNLIERIRTNQKLWDADEATMLEVYDYLIKLETERDLLFKAHSVEMVRADSLDVENQNLKVKTHEWYLIAIGKAQEK